MVSGDWPRSGATGECYAQGGADAQVAVDPVRFAKGNASLDFENLGSKENPPVSHRRVFFGQCCRFDQESIRFF